MSKNFLRNELVKLGVFIISLAIVHYLLLQFYLPALYMEVGPWQIYAFFVPLTIIGTVYIVSRFQKDHKSVANSFMIYTVVKILGALVLLGVLLFYIKVPSRPFVYQFLAIFFPFLFVETRLFVRMLSYSPSKFEKN